MDPPHTKYSADLGSRERVLRQINDFNQAIGVDSEIHIENQMSPMQKVTENKTPLVDMIKIINETKALDLPTMSDNYNIMVSDLPSSMRENVTDN